jgi:hypothetical protein
MLGVHGSLLGYAALTQPTFAYGSMRGGRQGGVCTDEIGWGGNDPMRGLSFLSMVLVFVMFITGASIEQA